MSSKLFKQRAVIILIGLTVFTYQSKAQSALTLEATQYYSSFKFTMDFTSMILDNLRTACRADRLVEQNHLLEIALRRSRDRHEQQR